MDAVLKNALCGEFNCHKKSTTSKTSFECFLKHDVCATLYILWQCSNSNRFCHFYRKHTVRFQVFVDSLGYSSNMRLTNTYRSYACGTKSTIYFFICLVQKTPLLLTYCSNQHYLLVLEVALRFTESTSLSTAILTVFENI